MAKTELPLSLRFLSLPAEVRDMIYPLLLIRTIPPTHSPTLSPALFTNDSFFDGPRTRPFRPKLPDTDRHLYPLDPYNNKAEPKGPSYVYPTILSTCKQIRSEAAPILYTNNAFEFNGSDRASNWIRTIDNEHACRVRDMTIWLPKRKRALKQVKEVMKTAKGLRRLHLHTHRMTIQSAEEFIKTFPKTVVPWLEEHETLRLAMSRDTKEYKDSRALRRYKWGFEEYTTYGIALGSRWQGGVCVTFVAKEQDGIEKDDGKCFDVGVWRQAMEHDNG
ncbi:MAG: hypothetical protein Q9225_005569, partial [Loekoesia sp. 1 TL-2023]